MSIQWGVMNLNTIVGALIAYFVLGGKSDDSNAVEADKGQVRILFLVFTIIAIVSNIFYFVSARMSVPSPPVTSIEKPGRKIWMTIKQAGQVTAQPVVALCIPQYLASSMSMNFVFSGFTGTAVKSTLGATNVSLIIICACIFDIAGAMGTKKYMGTLRNSRIGAIIGTVIQLLFFLILLAFPYQSWPIDSDGVGHTGQWFAALGLSALAGLGDGIQAISLTTTLAHLVGNDPNARAPAFSVLQGMKGLGSVLLFLLSAVTPYSAQLYVTMIILAIGIVGQCFALFTKGIIVLQPQLTPESVPDVELADELTPEQMLDMP